VQEFCYLGSIVTNAGNSDREIQTRTGKANVAFKHLNQIRQEKKLGIQIRMKIYNATVLAILYYRSESWALLKSNNERLEADHHWRLRRTVCISWKDMVTNEEVRKRCQQGTLQ